MVHALASPPTNQCFRLAPPGRFGNPDSLRLGRAVVDEPWVFPYAQVVRGLITAAFRAHGLSLPRERVTSGTLHLQKHLLATGRFLTITSNSVLQYNAEQWAVKALPIDLRIKPRPHAILRLKKRTLRPVVQLFIDELKAVADTAHKSVRKAATRSSSSR